VQGDPVGSQPVPIVVHDGDVAAQRSTPQDLRRIIDHAAARGWSLLVHQPRGATP
jgi:hypothetical protein